MPLDVQPLTPARRAVMLLVMLGLLAASLGFAEVLVRRQKPPIEVIVKFAPVQGVKEMPVNDTAERAFEGPLKKATAVWNGQQRTFVAFSFDADWDTKASWDQVLDRLCLAMTGVKPDDGVLPNGAGRINQQPAMQRWRIAAGDNPHFDTIRMTVIEGHVVAFGFSGEGAFTDKDIAFFEGYCATGIQIATLNNKR